jgi:zinc/manganese transport system substrate-binding protein
MWMKIFLAVMAFTWSALPATSSNAQERIRAVATFSILGDLVARVGGDRIDLKVLVGPESDAHVYQPSPADASAIARAQIVFQNGLGFEGWMQRLVRAAGYKGPVIIATQTLRSLRGKQETSATVGGKSRNEAGEVDPHAWQDPRNVLTYIMNIKVGLCAVDGDGCSIYALNATVLSMEIEALDGEIRDLIGSVPEARRKVITSHDAFRYFGAAYGIRFLSPRGISTEQEPSARQMALLIDQIRREKVTALFVEALSDKRLIEQIARETSVRPGGTLYSDALSHQWGPAPSYIKMMRHNARTIASALGAGF